MTNNITTLHSFRCDLSRGPCQAVLPHPLMHQDALADTFRAAVCRDNQPVDLTGMTVQGCLYLAATGQTVLLAGTAEGHYASVTLTEDCYALPGHASLVIQLQQGNVRHTILKVDFVITRTGTENIVAPGTLGPSLGEMLEKLKELEAATRAANDAAALAEKGWDQVTALADQTARLSQLQPEFANSIEDCTDTSKLYVLPDGMIYAYLASRTAGGKVPNFTNLMDDERSYIRNGWRYSFSTQVWTECANDCAIVIPIPASTDGFTLRIKDATYQGACHSHNAYFGNDGQNFPGTNSTEIFTKEDDGAGTVTYTQADNRNGYSYFVCHVASGVDADSLIVTLNEEITYSEAEGSVTFQWASTGRAFVPADYEDRIVAAENRLEDQADQLSAQADRLAQLEENQENQGGTDSTAAVPSLEHGSCAIFRKVVCCGDSFTCGYIGTNTDNIVGENHDFAWPSFMARLTGNEYVNCGHSGKNVWTWQASEKGLARAQAAGRAQAYLIGLGLNDSAQLDLGTAEDIGTENQTYYAGLSKMIRELHAISPLAKIFVQTIPSDYAVYAQYNQAMREVVAAYAGEYPVHLLDLYAYKHLYYTDKVLGDKALGHYTPIGYQQFAENLRYVWSEYINTHIADFQDVYLLPWDPTPADL